MRSRASSVASVVRPLALAPIRPCLPHPIAQRRRRQIELSGHGPDRLPLIQHQPEGANSSENCRRARLPALYLSDDVHDRIKPSTSCVRGTTGATNLFTKLQRQDTSCILQGDNSVGEFYSVAVTNNRQQADTGTKMIHLGKNTRSTIVSKGISAGHGQNTYRGLVRIGKNAKGACNFSQCDSPLIGDQCGAHTFPYLEVRNTSSQVEHEASTAKIDEDQIFYCRQRGLSTEDAINLIVNGFCKEVFRELPMEFAVEAQKLLGVSLEGSVG